MHARERASIADSSASDPCVSPASREAAIRLTRSTRKRAPAGTVTGVANIDAGKIVGLAGVLRNMLGGSGIFAMRRVRYAGHRPAS